MRSVRHLFDDGEASKISAIGDSGTSSIPMMNAAERVLQYQGSRSVQLGAFRSVEKVQVRGT